MYQRALLLVVLLCTVAYAKQAHALLLPGTWYREFTEDAVGGFDTLLLFVKKGTVSLVGSSDYSEPDWVHRDDSRYIFAYGNEVDAITYTVGFSDTRPFLLDCYLFSEGELMHAYMMRYAFGVWTPVRLTNEFALLYFEEDSAMGMPSVEPVPDPVPEPASMFLFGCGVFGLAACGRKTIVRK